MNRPDLINGGAQALKTFAASVIDLAAAHHDNDVTLRPWSGSDLCCELAAAHSPIHERLASTIYIKTRETLMGRQA